MATVAFFRNIRAQVKSMLPWRKKAVGPSHDVKGPRTANVITYKAAGSANTAESLVTIRD